MARSVAPETRYAQSGDLSIAFQVAGDAPVDIVFVPGFVSNVELRWEVPPLREELEGLTRFARVTSFDKRGTGLSDRTASLPTLEERMDDVRAVMDAAGIERAVLMAVSEGGPMSLLFAATYPERVSELVLWGSFACIAYRPDNPDGVRPDVLENGLSFVRAKWGTGRAIRAIAFQDTARDDEIVATLARYERNSATPAGAVAALAFGQQCDVRDVLSAISVRTLIVHRSGDPLVPVGLGRELAARIRGAEMRELPGDYHLGGATGGNDDLFDEVEEFLTGVRPERETPVERVLKTVLFTDIVGSTEQAAELGDRRWTEILDAHDAAVRRALARHGGQEVNTTGDGFFATFEGPARAIRCAGEIAAEADGLGVPIRAGLHTGECEVRGDDLAGIALHVGARVAAQAQPGEVLVTSTVRDLVLGAGVDFVDRGVQSLKGVPGEWHLLAVQA